MVKGATVNEKSGTVFFQGQGKVGEICFMSGKFGIPTKSRRSQHFLN